MASAPLREGRLPDEEFAQEREWTIATCPLSVGRQKEKLCTHSGAFSRAAGEFQPQHMSHSEPESIERRRCLQPAHRLPLASIYTGAHKERDIMVNKKEPDRNGSVAGTTASP